MSGFNDIFGVWRKGRERVLSEGNIVRRWGKQIINPFLSSEVTLYHLNSFSCYISTSLASYGKVFTNLEGCIKYIHTRQNKEIREKNPLDLKAKFAQLGVA